MNQYFMQDFIDNPWVLFLIMLWVMPWKGVALWRASRSGHMKWFIVLFLVNTLAILEIIYLTWFRKPKKEAVNKV